MPPLIFGPDWPHHGKVSGYAKGCRCEPCKAAKAAYKKASRTHAGGQLPPEDARHGTIAGGHAGCTCVACGVVMKAYRHETNGVYRRRTKDRYAARTPEQVIADRDRLRPGGVKHCNRCYKERPFSDFAAKATEGDGLRSYCNECETDRKRDQKYGYLKAYWARHGVSFDSCALCSGTFDHADHIYPRALGGPDADWNMQPLCEEHNRRKHASDPEVFYALLLSEGLEVTDSTKVEKALAYYLANVKPRLAKVLSR